MAIYTEEQTKYMIEFYQAAADKLAAVLQLAEQLDRPKKSIIGKLSKEGVYQKIKYKTKGGEDPVTKKEMLAELAELLEIDLEDIQGMEKSPKLELKLILDKIKLITR